MDMTQSIEPRSDQWNADDLIAGPVTVTISEVVEGKAEHPFDFKLVETPNRAYRPSKTCRRIIVAAWGADTKSYVGRRMTLYREPSIMFGGQRVGGIRVSAMSDIGGPVTVQAQTTRGKRETFTVQPLAASPTRESSQPVPVQAASEAATSDAGDESLMNAIARQVKAMQSAGQSAHLTTWSQFHGINPSGKALAEKFGEAARDIPKLMADHPMDVQP